MRLFSNVVLAVTTGLALSIAWAIYTRFGQVSEELGKALVK